ncbi:MAG: DUF1684 domain-containing protein [Flavisolibacter sp.]
MKTLIFLFSFLLVANLTYSQSYKDSMEQFQKNYVLNHDVVKADDKKLMQFFPVSLQYKVNASFEKSENGNWFLIPTSGKLKKIYRVYGILKFQIRDTTIQLNLYQSQDLMASEKYKNFLFLPFTDATSGVDSYGSGRYIDIDVNDIQNNQLTIDFNKAYNPYCAYVSGVYNCPIPPKENHLSIAILAGEKNYLKQ